jgi:AcrR family transcriptional regulator
MAKAGVPSRLRGASESGASTRQALTEAAIETLKSEGFAGTSARAIAKQAGCNQALIFYHFGSVIELLLAALDDVSARRLARYTEAVADVADVRALVGVAAEIFQEDLDQGYVTVLAEMIGGASATPGLGEQVVARIQPWKQFAEQAIAAGLAGSPLGSVMPVGDLAYAVVALYLGLEMLSHLDGDRSQALLLFRHAGQLAPLLELFGKRSTHE